MGVRKKKRRKKVKARVKARPKKRARAKKRVVAKRPRAKARPKRRAAAMNRLPGTAAWRKRWATGLVRRARAEGLRNITPAAWKRRWKAGVARYNPASPIVGTIKAMVAGPALSDYAYITGGFVAGAVFPRYILKALAKVGVAVPGGMVAEMLIGVGAAVAAGTGTTLVTKDPKAGIKVTAGGLAGVVGGAIVRYLEGVLPAVAGLGQDAETAIRAAVDEELRRAGLSGGMGEYLTTEMVEEAPEVSGSGGIGQFLTSETVEEAPEVSGLDQDITEGAAAFDGFEGDNF